MKKKLLHILSVFVAMAIAIPVANAAAGDYKINAPTKSWTTTFTTPNDNSRQLAISPNGVPYTLSETDKWYYNGTGYVGTYRITPSGPVLVNMGWWTAGAANAFDDAENYITHTAGSSGPNQSVTLNPATKYSVRTYKENLSANTGVFPVGKTIDMSTINTGGITLYCDATGDVYNANGLLWFAQTGTNTKITAISLGVSGDNLKATGKKEFDTGIKSGGGNDNYVQFYETSNAAAMKCLMLVRGVGIYDVTLNYTAGTVTSVNEIPCTANEEFNSIGAHIFTMRGRKLLCRNTRRLGSTGGERNRYSEFEILDITDSYTNPTKIATVDHLPNKYSNGPSAGNGHQTGSYIQTHKHSEDKVEIFAYVQGSGCSSYIITASAITNPVTSLSATRVNGTANNFTISWAKPSAGIPTKYAVQYSTDGSTWSTAVETTNLNYTYSNLPAGSYTFRVRPYYGGSGAWGSYATSSAVSTIADPVASLSAALANGSVNNITVSWAKPSATNPSKYSVSYSTNGGTSWSAESETTELSCTYPNLADGTYIFKVKPYYGAYWGNEATSNSVKVVNYTTPVSNLQVQTSSTTPYSATVVWGAPTEGVPTKYAVSYSSDGGTTWSSAVETTNLSYAFSNLAPGSYKFKVTPYYTNSWGEEAISNSTPVYGISNPATNITVAYAGNLGNSIAVSWDAPDSQIAPDKYQVCYSSNGGSSWTTPIETTNLTHTFADLSIGTYTFKVTPIYNGFPGDEAISESISVTEATGITFTTTKRWEVAGTIGTNATPDGRSIAVSNNKMYVAGSNVDVNIYHVAQNTDPKSWSKFESGFNKQYFGLAMDNDNVGNIIMASGSYFGSSSGFTQLTIYPAGATSNANKINISLAGDYAPVTRCDFLAAEGDVLSPTGGYVWLAPRGDEKIIRIKIVNGALNSVSTWPHSFASSTNTNQILVRPLSDGRLYVHHRGNQFKIITLPEPGTAITSSMMEQFTATGTVGPYGYQGSDMFILQGNIFQVRNDGAKDRSIGIVIRNLTNKDNEGNGDADFTPFDGKDFEGNNNGASGIAGYGSLVRSIPVDENNVDIYCYSPNHGVTVYRVSAAASYIRTDKLASLAYQYIENYDGNNKLQDIGLTWVAPANATPSSYKIYRDGALYKTVDGSTLTYTDKGVSQNYTYKVVPIFTGANEDGNLGLSVTTTEVETILFAPEITEVRNYDGYSIVEIFYQMPSYNKIKPATYNVYRNGVLLGSGMTKYNFIDDQLPKVLEDIDYTYTVEAVYGSDYNNETRTSEEMVVTVKARDWSLSGYQLQEIYNIAVSQAIGNLPNNFTNFEYYRQGHFYNGSWYIAQRADNLAKKDDSSYSGDDKYTEIESGVAGTTGGVVTIKAIEGIDVYNGFTGKPVTSEAFASVGLAIDDAGNIFMRHNNDSNADMATTAPAFDKISGLPVHWLTYISDGFTRRITRGAIYKHKGDGTYETEPIVLNLNPLWTSNDWINTMAFTYQNGSSGDKNGQVTGRSDYYSMYGDVMSAEGGYLIISPSWTRTIFKIKIANGQYVNHETHQIDQYQSANGMVNVKTGTENYGFKLDGRNTWMAQIRSNGYFGIHGEEENHEEGHEHETHAIFVADSRINNSGGTSIVAFDNETTAENDGETFLITPASMYSRNQGDFIVTRGTKTNITDLASEAKFMPPMPVAQMKQTSINSNVATNANGNWFHAEKGTYLNTDGENAECVYIYQYVPGIRFAKYRLIPDLSLPVVSPTLEITTAYNEGKTEITHFNGRSTWKRPETFGLTDAENSSVWIKSYTFELLDAHGNVVYSDEVPEAKDAEGNILMDYSFDYVADKNIDNVDNCDLDFQTYTARIAVNYEFINGDIQQSAFNYAIDDNNYPAVAPDVTNVAVFKQEDGKIQNWVEKDGEWVIEERIVDSYRVEINFDKPENEEPVSYYTLRAIRNKTVNGQNTTDTIDITNFDMHLGKVTQNGVTRAKYETVSQIPGTYDFENNKAPYYNSNNAIYGKDGESQFDGVLTWHHVVPAGTYGNNSTRASEVILEPDNWTFEVVAHYAARNRFINKDAADYGKADEIIVTGVEVIGEDNASSLQIYPIPASTEITIKSAEAINSIVIYNEAGAEVMSRVGNGETITALNIENLATGYYFVRVNNLIPVMIMKK